MSLPKRRIKILFPCVSTSLSGIRIMDVARVRPQTEINWFQSFFWIQMLNNSRNGKWCQDSRDTFTYSDHKVRRERRWKWVSLLLHNDINQPHPSKPRCSLVVDCQCNFLGPGACNEIEPRLRSCLGPDMRAQDSTIWTKFNVCGSNQVGSILI